MSLGPEIESVASKSELIGDSIEDLILTAFDLLKKDLKFGDERRRSEAMKLIVTHTMKAREQVTAEAMERTLAETRELMQEMMRPSGPEFGTGNDG